MPGLFQGLEIGKRALLTHQFTLQTIGHNIANVNTPGYSRQRVNITTMIPEQSNVGSIGSGVKVVDVRHARDLFLGEQVREDSKLLGQWSYKSKILSQIESLVNEPNENALGELLNNFWSSWSDLATGDQASRDALVSSTQELTNGFHQLANQLDNLRSSIDRDLVNLTQEINRYTSEIANINGQIHSQEAGSFKANDLRDVRDRLVDELSSIVDVNTVEQDNGSYTVYIGAMTIVDGKDDLRITADVVNKNGVVSNRLVWENTDNELKNFNGQLKGLVDSRDNIIPGYIDELHKLAASLIDEVNAVHQNGYGLDNSTGLNFFKDTYKDAFNIEINSALISNPSRIGASGSVDANGNVNTGDQTIALAIYELGEKKILESGTATFSDFYTSMIGKLGVESREATSFTNNYELLLNQRNSAKEAVQGVSLDEEMTNMIRAQHAYDAAARVITSMDQALDTVINGMGIVGR